MANDTTAQFGLSRKIDNTAFEKIDTNKTFAAADSGVVQKIVADGLTLTLPASATVGSGYTLTILNAGAPKTSGPAGTGDNGSVGITLTPASGDGITGGSWTAAINKGAQNLKATAQVGDYIRLVASGANTAAAWNVVEMQGNWTRTP